MLKARARWKVAEADERIVHHIASEMNLSLPLARLLTVRGFKDRTEVEAFLHPDSLPSPSPFLLPDMEQGVKRIVKAVELGEKILVYGDYDTDGVMSSTLMHFLFRRLGAHFSVYIPNRFQEGYGVHEEGIRKAAENGVKLIVTVDTGITAYEETELARSLGIDMVITDHHEPPDRLPEAIAVINPKRKDSVYPYPSLCGAGVALKMAEAILGVVPDEWWIWAAIGTVADLVPLVGENRKIVSKGLKGINRVNNPGLAALLKRAGLMGQRIDAGHIGFGIAPRINAAGRLSDARIAFSLFTGDAGEADRLADRLEALNRERQALVEKIYREAEAEALRLAEEGFSHLLLIAGEGWNEGVIGIVAARLVERFFRPVLLFSVDTDTGIAKGSARSIPGFSLYEQLTKVKELLLRFGGHAQAAGLTVEAGKIPLLRRRLHQLAVSSMLEEDLLPTMTVDLEISLGDVTLPLLKELTQLAPFGEGNREPLFLLHDVETEGLRCVGREGNHLKCRLRQGDSHIDAIGFNLGEKLPAISSSSRLQLVGEGAVREWNGREKPVFIIRDMQITEVQVFDRRGGAGRVEWMKALRYDPFRAVITFRGRNRSYLEGLKEPPGFIVPVNRKGEILANGVELEKIKRVALYDLPESFASLHSLRLFSRMEELWLFCQEEERDWFPKRLPSREEFIRFYAYLRARKRVAIERELWDIEKRSGLPREMLSFIMKVFEELSLLQVENGKLGLREVKKKRSFTESPTYVRVKEMLAVRELLLFSSPREIFTWLLSGDVQPIEKEGFG